MNISKSKYIPNSEVELWRWLNLNQNESLDRMADKFNMSVDSARHLSLLWAAGRQEEFNRFFYRLFEGSPTGF